MSEKIEMSVITRTQEVLGKYVKKPPLTEKLLRKPPFRYLHDIITTVSDHFISYLLFGYRKYFQNRDRRYLSNNLSLRPWGA